LSLYALLFVASIMLGGFVWCILLWWTSKKFKT
jgi:hypothetical protein